MAFLPAWTRIELRRRRRTLLVLTLPVTLLLANVLGAWPARQAARQRVGDVLRAD